MRLTPPAIVCCLIVACSADERPIHTLVAARQFTFGNVASHHYTFDLKAGHALAVRIHQSGADVRIVASAPGTRIVADTPARRFRDEFVYVPLRDTGAVSFDVVLGERTRRDASYVLTVSDFGPRGSRSLQATLFRTLAELGSTEPLATEQRAQELLSTAQTMLRADTAAAREWSALLRLRHAAFAYERLADWKLAASVARKAASLYRDNRETGGELDALGLEGAALIELANEGSAADRARLLQEAREQLLQCAARFTSAQDDYLAAHARNNAGLASQFLGESERALEFFGKAAQQFGALGASISEALALQNAAWVHYELGQYRLARQLFQVPLQIYERLGETERRRVVLNNTALAHSLTGETERAVTLYRQAIDLQRDKPDESELARSLHGLGSAYLRVGRPRRALPYLLEALPHRRSAHDGRGLLSTLIAVGNANRELGDLGKAHAYHAEAASLELGTADMAKAKYALALDLEAQGKLAEGAAVLDQVLTRELPAHVEVRGLALAARGRLHARTRDFAAAMSDLDAATRVMADNGAVIHEPLVLLERGRVLRALGRRRAAQRELERAAAVVESIRLQAVNPDLRMSILASQAAVYEELVDIMMELAADSPGEWLRALVVREHWRARTLLERLATIEPAVPAGNGRARPIAPPTPSDQASADAPVQHKLHDLYADLGAAKYRLDLLRDRGKPQAERIVPVEKEIERLRREIERLQDSSALAGVARARSAESDDLMQLATRMPPDTAILVYSMGHRRTWLWRVSRSGVVSAALPPRGEIEALSREAIICLRELRDAAPSDAGACRAQTGALGAAILPEGLVGEGIQRLLIVADGSLHQVPFAALALQRAGQTILALDRWELANLPSLALYAARSRDRTPFAPWGRIGLIAAASAVDPPHPVAAPLAGGQPRYEMIPALAGPVAGSFPAQWRGFDVLHFQTHGYSDLEDPNLSALDIPILDPGGTPGTARLFLGDIYRWRTNGRLVVLAACETGLGQVREGEGTLSLAHGFMSTGARHVMASLWRIGDAATRDLMAGFYRRLQDGDDPVRALAAAQRHLIANSRWKHPYFWAGLVAYE